MEALHAPAETAFRLSFDGKMTYEFYRELEDRIFDTMRRYETFEIDLSEVREIDLCGLHLLGLLQSFGVIVASSPVIEQASRHLLASVQANALGRVARNDHGRMTCH